MKPKLFVLKMPFEEEGKFWFCTHCALIEGALKVNPQWEGHIEVHRIPFPKPRKEIVDILGEEQQWLPVLVLENGDTITDPVDITNYIAVNFGGAAPHP
ncbi:DUF3088 family protein [Vibrio sonorensis]|uniref:DUF3088 family protein n=1 Tax=Vibrio sonorensis TaxID=1004316 RepID=UPI0008DA9152|nr:DUF3088 family protein [Vibrio sonorensis]